jgi:histidinol-phosphate aminotransferase
MPLSRRSFVATLGAGASGLVTAPLISWRGHEDLLALQSQLPRQQQPTGSGEARAERLLASLPGMVRLDSNENPNGPGRAALDAITRQLSMSNRYPVKEQDDLIAALARIQGVAPENILLGCGSGELLRVAVQAFTSPTRGLVAADPTFEAPVNFAKFLKHPIVSPRVTDSLALDLDAMAAAAPGSGLIYFCNPNNPTATVHGASDVNAFVDRALRAAPDTTILIDEAYHEYVANPAYRTAIPLALSNPRVIVTRTFSKVFGMAGLRLGYAVARPETIKQIAPWMLGSNTNQLVLAAAVATAGDQAHIADEQRKNAEARAFTRKFFESAGYTVPAADANFLMVDIRRDPHAFKLDCAKHKVAIGRKFPALPKYARISIGTMPEMKKAVEVFRTVLAAPAATHN